MKIPFRVLSKYKHFDHFYISFYEALQRQINVIPPIAPQVVGMT